MKRFGVNFTKSETINDVVIYKTTMFKDEFEKFRAKKGYKSMKVGLGEVQVAPKGHELNSTRISLYYRKEELVLAVNTKGD